MAKFTYEHRSVICEVRAEQHEGKYTIKGLPVVLNKETNLGRIREMIASGALDKTDLRDVRFLVNHDLNMIPLARSRNNNENSTMRLKPTERGLEIEADLDVENNADARKLYSAVQRGDISGMSFMFAIRGYEWKDIDTDLPLRIITDIAQIIEVSAVTLPAYESTEISARNKDSLDSELIRELDSLRASLDNEVKQKRELELLKEKAKYLY